MGLKSMTPGILASGAEGGDPLSGSNFYLTGTAGDNVDEFELSTTFDISTASAIEVFGPSFSNPEGLYCRSDGKRIYLCNATNVRTIILSTAWDLSTASNGSNVSLSATVTTGLGVAFLDDGSRMYIADGFGNTIREFTLATDWDVSTFTAADTFVATPHQSAQADIFVKADGTKLYLLNGGNNTVFQYSMTAGDLTTISYDSKSFSASSQNPLGRGFCISDDGFKLYVIGVSGQDTVFQYSLSTAFDISTASYDSKSKNISGQDSAATACFIRGANTQ